MVNYTSKVHTDIVVECRKNIDQLQRILVACAEWDNSSKTIQQTVNCNRLIEQTVDSLKTICYDAITAYNVKYKQQKELSNFSDLERSN